KIKAPAEEGKKTLNVKLKFLDNYNNEQVIEKQINIMVYKKKENGFNPLIGLAVFIVAVVLIWYFKLRKRKDKHAAK
ncbi:MAG: hypothetical protein QXV64_02965, partial [Candidatus Anstonellaceae archaeon]